MLVEASTIHSMHFFFFQKKTQAERDRETANRNILSQMQFDKTESSFGTRLISRELEASPLNLEYL